MTRSRRLSRSGGAESGGHQDEVKEAANELVELLVKGPGKERPEKYRQALAEARERVEAAERAVVEHNPATGGTGAEVTWRQVREALPAGAVLVAFARYLRQPVTVAKGAEGVPSYLMFVSAAGTEPLAVPLGPAAEIEDAVMAWQTEISRRLPRDPLRAAEAEASCRLAGERVRSAIWDPIAERIGQAETVYVVPESMLHLVHFDAMPRKGGGYLIEARPAIHQLTAEKDLLTSPRAGSRGTGLLAMGGAAFDRQARGGRTPAEPGSQVRAATRRPTCPEFQSIRFAPLAHTDAEVREVARAFHRAEASTSSRHATVVLRGESSTEASFRTLAPGKRILHLATHGFFLGESCRPVGPADRGIGGLVGTTEVAPAPSTADSPLQLAGLALAGANQRASAANPADDGILTAEEIALLNLQGVEWAVLSACDSGAGTVAIGEGVLGLRRAFLIAGARSVIMSLWAVDDAAGRAWMKALYEARFGKRACRSFRRGALRDCRPIHSIGPVSSPRGIRDSRCPCCTRERACLSLGLPHPKVSPRRTCLLCRELCTSGACRR
jgi:CHAT domain-containing protein